jgi:ClpP class serine protease
VTDRKEILEKLEKVRNSRVIFYATSDRKGQETQIGDDVLPCFSQHMARIGEVDRLDLVLYSRGGSTLTGFALANSLRQFCRQFGVLVPFRAHSCATLIALGANEIVMGPFGQLSPIDPSITTPHGPTIEHEGKKQFLPVSVEDVANYIELARKEVGLKDEAQMAAVLGHLCQRVSPLALGAVYRAREQIGMLATKLMKLHTNDEASTDRVVKKLTRELLSHDYVISRREGKEIGLPIVDASAEIADLIWTLYEQVAQELQLNEQWNPEKEVRAGQVVRKSNVRGVLQSRDLKHKFETTYELRRVTITDKGGKAEALQGLTLDEGWRVA